MRVEAVLPAVGLIEIDCHAGAGVIAELVAVALFCTVETSVPARRDRRATGLVRRTPDRGNDGSGTALGGLAACVRLARRPGAGPITRRVVELTRLESQDVRARPDQAEQKERAAIHSFTNGSASPICPGATPTLFP